MPTAICNMMDLAANAEKVYADNYPGDRKDLEPKKHWWQPSSELGQARQCDL